MRLPIALLSTLLPAVAMPAGLSAQDQPPQVTFIAPAGAAATLPFSPGVRVGHMLYLAGQLGTDSTNRLVAGGIEPETRQTLTNIKNFLDANEIGRAHV